jgi:hypothetical protein
MRLRIYFEDLDGDGDKGPYHSFRGNAFKLNEQEYMSRYFVNDGKGKFIRSRDFPVVRTNAGAILAFDYDGDKDLDIIIGGRSTPGRYPEAPKSFLLQNDHGKFKDVTHEFFPELENLGMITDIKSGDLDGDQKPEVVFAGDWLPVTIFQLQWHFFQKQNWIFWIGKNDGMVEIDCSF